MIIHCIWEHNGTDTLLYAADFAGAYTRGASLDEALQKMPDEIRSYCRWLGTDVSEPLECTITQEVSSSLLIRDADSDVLFDEERLPLSPNEYHFLKAAVLRSAHDFLTLYHSIPDVNQSCLPARKTFYGSLPCTAKEMYDHTKSVNSYYFGEIGIPADNEGNIFECRQRGFEQLEKEPDFLSNLLHNGSYNELWTLRKLLRRFLWHDRIHAKAMRRMALRTFPEAAIPNPFCFE